MTGQRIVMLLLGTFSPDPRVEREARTLSQNGYQVTVLAWNRDGKLAGYEKRESYYIHRMGPPLPSAFSRASIRFQATIKALVAAAFSLNAVLCALRESPGLVYSHDLDTLHIGVLVKMLMPFGRVKLVYDSHEDYPAMLTHRIGHWGGFLCTAMERAFLKAADGVIASNDYIAAKLRRHHDNIETVMNTVDLEWFDRCAGRRTLVYDQGPYVTYVGGMEEGRGVESLLRAKKTTQCRCTILVVGGSPRLASLREIGKKEGISGINFTGQVERDNVPSILKQSSVGIILYESEDPNNLVAVPNKLFEYAAASLPIVVSDVPGLAAFVRHHKCGLVVNMTDVRDVSRSIDRLLSSPSLCRELGENGRNAVELFYNWDRQSQNLLSFLGQIVGRQERLNAVTGQGIGDCVE